MTQDVGCLDAFVYFCIFKFHLIIYTRWILQNNIVPGVVR